MNFRAHARRYLKSRTMEPRAQWKKNKQRFKEVNEIQDTMVPLLQVIASYCRFSFSYKHVLLHFFFLEGGICIVIYLLLYIVFYFTILSFFFFFSFLLLTSFYLTSVILRSTTVMASNGPPKSLTYPFHTFHLLGYCPLCP